MTECKKSCCWTPYTCARQRSCRCHRPAGFEEQVAATRKSRDEMEASRRMGRPRKRDA